MNLNLNFMRKFLLAIVGFLFLFASFAFTTPTEVIQNDFDVGVFEQIENSSNYQFKGIESTFSIYQRIDIQYDAIGSFENLSIALICPTTETNYNIYYQLTNILAEFHNNRNIEDYRDLPIINFTIAT